MNAIGVRRLAAASKVKDVSLKPLLSSSILLSRIPVVSPELTEFEKQYFNYQSELEKRLMWTFPYYFYFKRGTLSEKKFFKAQNYPISKQPGVWFPKGVPDIRHNRDRRRKQEVILPKEGEEDDASGIITTNTAAASSVSRPIKPNPRVTEADKINDKTSLDRKLDRTLYLLLQRKDNKLWEFPNFPLKDNESLLHTNADNGLKSLTKSEDSMKVWMVSNTPALMIKPENEKKPIQFLFKSHILNGQFNLKNSEIYSKFNWLTREEIENTTDKTYFENVSCLLSRI